MKKLRTEKEIINNWGKNKKPLVSICCITYNHEKYIQDAIESFLIQETNFPFEILIHDDASTDETASIIRKYEKRYPKLIKPIYQKENQYSKGLKMNQVFNSVRASGKYIAWNEGDDYWTDKKKLQIQFDFMEKNKNFSMCTHSVGIINAVNDKKIGEIKPYKESRPCSAEDAIIKRGGFLGTNSFFYRKKFFNNPPKWFFNFPVGDYPLQVYMALNGGIYFMKNCMSVYRRNVDSSWSNRRKKIKVNKIEEVKYLKKIISCFSEIKKDSNIKYGKYFDKLILKLLIHKNFKLNNLGKTKHYSKEYFRKYGFLNKMFFYYIATFIGKKGSRFVANVFKF